MTEKNWNSRSYYHLNKEILQQKIEEWGENSKYLRNFPTLNCIVEIAEFKNDCSFFGQKK